MHSTQVIVTVKQLELSLREQGIGAIYLFGPVARETQADTSDINLAFDLAPGATESFSLIDQSRCESRANVIRSGKLLQRAIRFVPRAELQGQPCQLELVFRNRNYPDLQRHSDARAVWRLEPQRGSVCARVPALFVPFCVLKRAERTI